MRFAPRHGRYVIWRRLEAWGWYTRQFGQSWPGYANANEVAVFPPAPATRLPLDTDGDGLPDFREDADGDGLTGAMETDFTSWDSDEDGCSDAEEVRQGTDPRNPDSLVPKRLGWWRFNQPGWEGEQGQLPRQAVGLQRLPSWSGTALGIPYSGTANLKYHDTEPGGMNINCRRGTVRFWFRPNWSTGSGPWTWARLIELGAYTPDGSYGFWAIYLNPEGNLLQFFTQGGGTGAAAAAFVNWTAGVWYQITVTYGPTASIIYVNGEPVATGSGVTRYPAATVRQATGLNVGSNSNGDQRVNGQIEELETFNFELSAATIQAEYEAMRAPSNDLDIRLPGLQVNTPVIPATVTGTPAAQMAVRLYLTDVETPDFSNLWGPFLPGFGVDLGTGDGPRYLWVGFRGVDPQGHPGPELWRKLRVVLDTTPPVITLSEPEGATTSQPVIQVQGTANEGLNHVSYDLVNGNGTWLHEAGLVLPEVVDEATFDPIAWPFQLFDVELAPGVNSLTLRATDLAGNTATLPLNYTLDLSGDTTPPGITLRWPLDGAEIASDTFDLRGQVDDACASVTVSGLTPEPVVGLVERNGQFWVEGLPLRPDANVLTLTATDAVGNVRSQTLTLNRSSVTLTIHEPSEAELAQARLTVTGTISEAGYAVWVNGVRASLTPDGTVWAWQAEAVPLGEGGTAVLQARAIPLSHHHGAGDGGGPAGSTAQGNPADSTARDTELQRDRPARLYVMRYTENSQHSYGTCGGFRASYTTFMRVHHNSGGYRHCVYWDNAGGSVDHPYQYWTGLTDEGGCNVCDPESIYPHGDPWYWKEVPWEVCNVTDVQPRECVNDTYSRAARTILRLQTGGKGIAGRQLFSFTVNAWKFTNPREQPPYPQDSFVRAQITDGVDPSTIRMLGRPVGADGYLYEVLPDNAEFTVTPQAPERFYLFNVNAQKHKLWIIANNVPLADFRAVPSAEWVIGQKVVLEGIITPTVPGLCGAQPTWSLQGEYVNAVHVQNSAGCPLYEVWPHWHWQNPTRAWWLTKGQKKISLGMRLRFNNRQSVWGLIKCGSLRVYAPDVAPLEPLLSGYLALFVQKGIPPRTCLELNSMGFKYTLQSKSPFEGEMRLVQLCQLNRERDISFGIGGTQTLTTGPSCLDGTPAYVASIVTADNGFVGTVILDDQPYHEVGTTYVTIYDRFTDFLQFKPFFPDSIWATLRRATWSWAAIADKVSDEWVLSQFEVVSPTEESSNEVVYWDETF